MPQLASHWWIVLLTGVLPIVVHLVLALIVIVRTAPAQLSPSAKLRWILFALFVPIVGFLVWAIFGRSINGTHVVVR